MMVVVPCAIKGWRILGRIGHCRNVDLFSGYCRITRFAEQGSRSSLFCTNRREELAKTPRDLLVITVTEIIREILDSLPFLGMSCSLSLLNGYFKSKWSKFFSVEDTSSKEKTIINVGYDQNTVGNAFVSKGKNKRWLYPRNAHTKIVMNAMNAK